MRAAHDLPHLLVMAKAPVAGTVKTRLCPPCSPEEAAAVAAASLVDTLDAVGACSAGRKVVALEGEVGPWLPPGFEVVAQRGSTLAERLARAWADTGGAGVQIGMDTPQVTATELDALLAAIAEGDERRALLGPAADGGWWAIGLSARTARRPHAVFEGVATSSPVTGADQHRRLRSLGLDVIVAGLRRDIDTVADLNAVAAEIPDSRTGAQARLLGVLAPR